MVIDIDPEFGLGGGVQSIIAEARLGGAIECNADIDIEWLCGRSLDSLAFCHET